MKKKWSELRNKEDWDDECENCERPIMLHIGPCKPRKSVIGDNEYRNICREWRWFKQTMNLIIKKHEIDGDNNEENVEITDEEDDENKVEIEEIENEVGVIVQDLSNQLDRSADYSSYDDKMRLDSADNSTYDDKSSIESAVTVSHNDNLRIETAEK